MRRIFDFKLGQHNPGSNGYYRAGSPSISPVFLLIPPTFLLCASNSTSSSYLPLQQCSMMYIICLAFTNAYYTTFRYGHQPTRAAVSQLLYIRLFVELYLPSLRSRDFPLRFPPPYRLLLHSARSWCARPGYIFNATQTSTYHSRSARTAPARDAPGLLQSSSERRCHVASRAGTMSVGPWLPLAICKSWEAGTT